MSLMEFWDDEQITGTVSNGTQSPPVDGEWTDELVYASAGTITGVKYSVNSHMSKYLTTTWAEDVTHVLVTDDKGNASLTGRLVISSETWEISGIDDVADLGEIYLIGIKVHR